LDYKIVVGDSLISKLGDTVIDLDWNLNDTSYGLYGAHLVQRKAELLKIISEKQKEFFNTESDKKKLAFDIRNLKIDLLINQLDLMVKTKGIETEPRETSRKFTEQNELFCQTLGWKENIIQLNNLKKQPENPLNFFEWKLDFPEVLNEAINVNPGFDIVIANPPYVNIANINDEKYRSIIQNKYSTVKNKSDLYSVFIERSFYLTKKKGKNCFIYPKTWMGTDSFSKFREFLINNFKIHKIINLGYGVFENATVSTIISVFSRDFVENQNIELFQLEKSLEGKTFFKKQINNLSYQQIKSTSQFLFSLEKQINLRIDLVPLGDLIEFSLGVKTSDDKKFIVNFKKDNDTFPMLRGKNIRKYEHDSPKEFIWYKPHLMMKKVGAGPRRIEYFQQEKILIQGICNGVIRCAYDDEKILVNDKVHIAFNPKKHSIKSILAILNSDLMSYVSRSIFGNYLEIKINQLNLLPFPNKITKKIELELNFLVDQRIKCDEGNKKLKIEDQINKIVYALYKLEYKEVKLIDPKINFSEEEYKTILTD
jgi:hypothetical protein